MAITKFQPEVWAATLLSTLSKKLVYAGSPCVNRNYEGDIKDYGDTVHVVSVADPTISTYTKDTNLSAPQALTDSEQLLVVDQAKSFNFQVDDIDARQVRNNGNLMSEAAQRAGFGLADVADQYVASLMAAGASTANSPGRFSVSSTAADVYDKILVPMSVKLDEANVPSEGRWVVVTPALYGKLLQDSRFIKANESGTAALHNGRVGDAAGFVILKSNNAPASASRAVTDGATTNASKTVTSATAVFSSADVGKSISGTGIPASTTIASVESATSVTTSANSTATGTGVTLTIGDANAKLIIAGSSIATSYAEQISKVEAYRPELRFGDALKGLHLYGGKVIRPTALATSEVVVTF